MKAASNATVLVKKEDCSVLDEHGGDLEPERCPARERNT
jgi:hypothetical protein